jgi:hypothetical protein
LDRGSEGLLGPRRLVQREPRLAIGVVRLRQMRCGMAGVAGGLQCRLCVTGPRMGSVGGEEPQMVAARRRTGVTARGGLADLRRLERIEQGKWLTSLDPTLEGLHYNGEGGAI